MAVDLYVDTQVDLQDGITTFPNFTDAISHIYSTYGAYMNSGGYTGLVRIFFRNSSGLVLVESFSMNSLAPDGINAMIEIIGQVSNGYPAILEHNPATDDVTFGLYDEYVDAYGEVEDGFIIRGSLSATGQNFLFVPGQIVSRFENIVLDGRGTGMYGAISGSKEANLKNVKIVGCDLQGYGSCRNPAVTMDYCSVNKSNYTRNVGKVTNSTFTNISDPSYGEGFGAGSDYNVFDYSRNLVSYMAGVTPADENLNSIFSIDKTANMVPDAVGGWDVTQTSILINADSTGIAIPGAFATVLPSDPPVSGDIHLNINFNSSKTIDLRDITSDDLNDIDWGSLIISQMPASGAAVTKVNYLVTLDYAGTNFEGEDFFAYKVKDAHGISSDDGVVSSTVYPLPAVATITGNKVTRGAIFEIDLAEYTAGPNIGFVRVFIIDPANPTAEYECEVTEHIDTLIRCSAPMGDNVPAIPDCVILIRPIVDFLTGPGAILNKPPLLTGSVVLTDLVQDTVKTFTSIELLDKAINLNGGALSVVNLTASVGTVVYNGSTAWTFTPDNGYTGDVSISYGISDGIDTVETVTSFNYTPTGVEPINNAPTQSGQVSLGSFETNAVINITKVQLLANASDLDSDPLDVVSISISAGSLVADGNTGWDYTPVMDSVGVVTLNYTVTDGTDTVAASATITLTAVVVVEPVNTPPTVSGEVALGSFETNTTIVITKAQLLTNVNDVDTDPLAIAAAVADTGTIINNGNGTWSYTPVTDAVGNVTLSYEVSDGTVSIAVTAGITLTAVPVPVNNAPVSTGPITLSSLAINNSRTITSDMLLVNTTDADSDLLTVTNLTADSGTLVIDGNDWTFTPVTDLANTITLSYSVTDGEDTIQTTATFVVTSLDAWQGTIVVGTDGVLRSEFADGTTPVPLHGPMRVFLQDGSVSTNGLFDAPSVVIDDPDAYWHVMEETPLDGTFTYYDGGAFDYVAGSQTGTASFTIRVTDGVSIAFATMEIVVS